MRMTKYFQKTKRELLKIKNITEIKLSKNKEIKIELIKNNRAEQITQSAA